jgi:hypothetical protein
VHGLAVAEVDAGDAVAISGVTVPIFLVLLFFSRIFSNLGVGLCVL